MNGSGDRLLSSQRNSAFQLLGLLGEIRIGHVDFNRLRLILLAFILHGDGPNRMVSRSVGRQGIGQHQHLAGLPFLDLDLLSLAR